MKKKMLLLSSIFGLIIAFTLFIARSIFLYNITGENFNMNQSSLPEKENSQSVTTANSSHDNILDKDDSVSCINSSGNVIITVPEFINDMQCSEYTLKPGDTLTSIARRYISTCTLNSALKLIKEVNNITNANLISTGSKIKIPETILSNGYIHTVVYGDTWDKLCLDYYPIYNSDYMSKILIFINDLPDNNLPLGTEIYLPNINI
ncbi:MAG: LysM domain-containing protein [Clostridium sp.]|nr:LysM domain-containing protein [Clostridium sp.]